MITKEQVIVILEAALANPNYLSTSEDGVNWFCASVGQVCRDICRAEYPLAEADEIQSTICDDYIYPSIEGYLFLRSYLFAKGILSIGKGTSYESQAYKEAAHAHWQALIEKVKAVEVHENSKRTNEILLDHLEMSLCEEVDDDQRGETLEAIAKLESQGIEFPVGEWSVMTFHAFVMDELGYDLDLDDVEFFGKILNELNTLNKRN